MQTDVGVQRVNYLTNEQEKSEILNVYLETIITLN